MGELTAPDPVVKTYKDLPWPEYRKNDRPFGPGFKTFIGHSGRSVRSQSAIFGLYRPMADANLKHCSLLWHTCVPVVVRSSPFVACSRIPCIFVKKNETRMCCDCATTMKIPRRVRYECVKTNYHLLEFATIYAANLTRQ